MNLELGVWLAALALLPGAVLLACLFGASARRLYVVAASCAAALACVSALPLVLVHRAPAAWPLPPLSMVLVPFAALLWLLTVVVTPSGRRTEAGFARTAAACMLDLGAFLTDSPVLLLAIWAAGGALLLASHPGRPYARARRVAAAYLTASTVLLAAGVALAGPGAGPAPWGAGLILAAVLARNGIFPFHAWIPETFERGRIGPVARFAAPQLGAYVALVLALPRAGAGELRVAALLALLTAVYGSFLALHQSDARRACGYLFVSQSALVMAGLDLRARDALVGSLILWLCSGLALAALARAVLALEARRGRLRLDVRHGGYERMPQLAVCFLVMCLAIADFPGTLGFVGAEVLVRATVDAFPLLGLLAVAAVAMAGLAALRMYFSLFCGRKDSGAHLAMRRREGLGFAVAALALVGFGLAPGGLVRALSRGGDALLRRPAVGLAAAPLTRDRPAAAPRSKRCPPGRPG